MLKINTGRDTGRSVPPSHFANKAIIYVGEKVALSEISAFSVYTKITYKLYTHACNS